MSVSNFLGPLIAHRGASADAPENTLAAFNKALSLGCRAIEFDVMLSADGQPYIIHDTSLTRTTNGRGEVGLVEAQYLESLDAGKWFAQRFVGEKIPHFSEVIRWLNFSNVNANIEIKPYPGKGHETTVAVLSCLHQEWLQGKALPLISSFDLNVLDLCRELAPELPLGMLLPTWQDDWHLRAEALHCYSIHLHHKLITEERVRLMKDQGYVVYAYVVNQKRQAKKLLALGVDAVFSDHADLL